MARSEQISLMVRTMGDIVCHYGQRDYTAALAEDQSLIVTLCGLTVFFKGKQAVRLKAHNFDLAISAHPLADVANDTGSPQNNFNDQHLFVKGNYEALLRWHNCISAFQSLLRKDSRTAA